MSLPEAIDEPLALQVLTQLGYSLRDSRYGLCYYADTINMHPLLLDFSRGAIPLGDFARALQEEGVNLDTFYAILESI